MPATRLVDSTRDGGFEFAKVQCWPPSNAHPPMNHPPLTIDRLESFPSLPSAPIVEATLAWTIQPTEPPNTAAFGEALQRDFGETAEIAAEYRFTVEHQTAGEQLSVRSREAITGFRLQILGQDEAAGANDRINAAKPIVRFTTNTISYTQLQPYTGWPAFRDEARQWWNEGRRRVAPSRVEAIGVRYVNFLPVDSVDDALSYLHHPPTSPDSLPIPIAGFFRQLEMVMPDRRYGVDVVQTVQPSAPGSLRPLNLVIELTAGTRVKPAMNLSADADNQLDGVLADLRWLKNKTFFGLFSGKAIDQFKTTPQP